MVVLGLMTLLTGCGGERDPSRQPAREPSYVPVAGNMRLPFSAAVRIDGMLYLSGQIGADSTGKLVPGGIAAETRQTMDNIRAVVQRNGSSMDRVVRCLVMLADMSEWGAMNQVYVTYFPHHLPARSAMGASGLALGARVEIECLAAL
ncbi:MAG: RidA family protein [Gemmatimonadales bacterium]|nr:RidA family protein [Gemmatimonadales bacterium]